MIVGSSAASAEAAGDRTSRCRGLVNLMRESRV